MTGASNRSHVEAVFVFWLYGSCEVAIVSSAARSENSIRTLFQDDLDDRDAADLVSPSKMAFAPLTSHWKLWLIYPSTPGTQRLSDLLTADGLEPRSVLEVSADRSDPRNGVPP